MIRGIPTILFLGFCAAAMGAGGDPQSPQTPAAIEATDVRAGPATVPLQLNHQGIITVNGQRFDGLGRFYFALLDPDTGNNLWTNDGTNIGSSARPLAFVELTVSNGVYSVRLGDTTLASMDPVPTAVFDDGNVHLRIWFNDNQGNGIQQLAPDQVLTSAPYAFKSSSASVADLATAAVNRPIIGEVRLWAGRYDAVLPAGWRLCDGAEVSRATYEDLFDVIGDIYGAGDLVNTFNLPNFRNRSPMGASVNDTDGRPKTEVSGTPQQSGGTASQLLTTAELPSHTHSGTTSTGNAAFYRLLFGAGSGSAGNHATGFRADQGLADFNDINYPTSQHTHNFTTDNGTGGNQPHNNLHPYFAITYIIYTGVE